MKVKHLVLISLAALLAGLLSACTNGSVGSSWPGMTADEDAVYLSGGAYVYAIRLNDGTEMWHYPEKADNKRLFFAAPVLTPDGQLIVGSGGSNYTLYSLNPKNGSENWGFGEAKDRWVGSPLVGDDIIYAPNSDGELYALDFNGKRLWTFTAGGPLWAQPISDSQLIYVASLDHRLYAIDPQSPTDNEGRKEAAWAIELDGAIAGAPAASTDGLLYVGSVGASLTAIDMASHDIRWSAPTDKGVWSGPTLDGKTLFFGDLSGKFYSLNAEDGSRNWEPQQPDGSIVGSPSVMAGYVIFTTETGSVYALDRNGETAWTKMVGGKIYTAPLTAGDLILVAPMQAEFLLAALDKDGHQAWTFQPQK